MKDFPHPPRPSVVLLVEDNPLNRDMLSRWLTADGWTVVCAETGEKGVAKAQELHPPVILMDIDLPGIDGWEAIRRIRDIDLPSNRILALTAYAFTEHESRARALGCEGFFSKPIDLKALSDFLGPPVTGEPSA